jgi:1-acyl-sn-glycerol-3-phosphate acyltransferase
MTDDAVTSPEAASLAATADADTRLLATVEAMLRELRGGDAPRVGLDDDLERTLGIDSLARMELMLRLEAAFAVRLSESQVQQAQTARDLLRALAAAAPREGPAPRVAAAAASASAAAVERPHAAQTLVDVLAWYAERTPQRVQVSVLDDEAAHEQPVTHAALLQRSRQVAAGLQRTGVEPGDRVALMLPTGVGLFEAFAGILWAGGVPVPIYPPLRATQIEDHLRRQANILDNAQAVLLVTDQRVLPAARILRAGVPSLRGVTTVDELAGTGGVCTPVARGTQDIAFLQYTSGSTGQPKGVVLTHANLLANLRAMGQAVKATPADVFVSWLPLYHDMGLIGAWMGSLYHALPLVVMPPQAFLARPSRWLRLIHERRGTISAAPNFAYEILASRVPDDELQGLDLSCWRAAFNGAEPVHASSLARFAERFARYGFDPRALMPVYGLAECGVGLAFPPLARGPKVDCIEREALHTLGQARPAVDGDLSAAMHVVCCGAPLAGHELRVVDTQGEELPERHEGRVEFRGPSATSGYFRNAEATRALFDGDWLDSGDVGYIAEGELYLTSRVKDLIIRGGHNVHPYDLEDAVGNLPGVRKGCVAVFGARDAASATERIVVLAETRLADVPARAALRERIAGLALELLGLPADDIVLAAPHTVLKTSSGKIRRAACRERYEQGALGGHGRAVPLQVARLWLDAAARRLRQPLTRLAIGLHGAWMWALFGLGAVLGVVAVLLPGRARRQRTAGALARLVVRASGVPVHVAGLEHLAVRPAVIAVNHASYVDWLLLAAVLPAGCCFVAKRELAAQPTLRWLLSRLGTQFVERSEVRASVEDARRLRSAAAGGESLVFFPEGTFTRAPGLCAFHMGAFVTAAEAGLPVIPISLAGTRSVLRAGSWWPRRHPVQVQVHPPLKPAAAAWGDALQLRDATRACIASACGEPKLPG